MREVLLNQDNRPGIGYMNRRIFLGVAWRAALGLPLLLSACAGAPARSGEIHKTEGDWAREDVEYLARSMMEDSRFNDVAYAGQMLLGNQAGQPTFSKESSIFTNDRVRVTTVSMALAPYEHYWGAIGALLVDAGSEIQVVLKGKDPDKDWKFSAPTQKRLSQIFIHKLLFENISEFALRFFVAKEIYNIKAYDLASNFILNNIDPQYLSENKRLLDATRIHLMGSDVRRSKTEEFIKAGFMGDVWALFLLVPNYQFAVDQGIFEERDKEWLDVFQKSVNFFLNEGILERDESGKYTWVGESDRVFDTWWRQTLKLSKGFQ